MTENLSVTYTTVTKGMNITPSNREGFFSAFKQAFAGPPYKEHYTDEQVAEEVWDPHMHDGITILAHLGNRVIGFGCAVPLAAAPEDVRDFLSHAIEEGRLPAHFTLDTSWYMSELGVIEEYREHGLAYELVMHRLITIDHKGGRHYVMRTAVEGSNSRHLYERTGAIVVEGTQDISDTEQVIVNGSESTQRVYLYGECDDAMRTIAQIKLVRTAKGS